MKTLTTLLFALILFVVTINAQVTTNFSARVSGGSLRIMWTFTQTSDTTSVLYSPKFSTLSYQQAGKTSQSYAELFNDFAYYSLQGSNSGFTIKQTKLTATPKTAITFQGLSNSGVDTVNCALLRLAVGVQTTGDTSGVFKIRGIGNDYRIKLTNTGGRITSGVISLIFTKPTNVTP